MTDALASEEIMNGKQTQDSLEELGHGENIDKSLARHDFKIGREYVSVGFQVIEISWTANLRFWKVELGRIIARSHSEAVQGLCK